MIVVKFVKSVWSVGLWIFPVSKRKTIHGETFSMKILVCVCVLQLFRAVRSIGGADICAVI